MSSGTWEILSDELVGYVSGIGPCAHDSDVSDEVLVSLSLSDSNTGGDIVIVASNTPVSVLRRSNKGQIDWPFETRFCVSFQPGHMRWPTKWYMTPKLTRRLTF